MGTFVGLRDLRQRSLVPRVKVILGTRVAVAGASHTSRACVMDLLIAETADGNGARRYTCDAADLVGMESPVDVITV